MGKTPLFGIQFDALRMNEVVARLLEWIQEGDPVTRFVVTPNVDHTVLFHERAELRAAYARAALVVADGRPVVMASRLLGRRLPECVPGSDLVPTLFERSVDRGELRVFLLGAAPGVAERAAQRVVDRWPHVRVVGTYCPPLGFEHDENENKAILSKIDEACPQVLVVGLGAPKQELWVDRFRNELHVPVTLCVGATIDFLAGERRRAPVWMRKLSLEWLHRMLSEPRRLVPRYARDAWVFPQLIVKQLWEGLTGRPQWQAR